MRDWITWVILLIGAAVWVLSNVFRNREEPRRPVRAGTPPADGGEAPSGPRPRRSAAEIEEFLQEVRRRREGNEQRKKKPTRQESSARREPETPRPRPSLAMPEPVTWAPLPPPPTPAPSPALRRRERPVPTSVPVVVPVGEEVVVARLVEDEPSAYSAPPAASPLRALLPSSRGRPGFRGNPALLLQVLRQPQSLAAAIVLREILDPPLSTRRRSRRSR